MLASRLGLKKEKIKKMDLRSRRWGEERKNEKKRKTGRVCPTWIDVVVEEEEDDGEGDGAGKDASEALDIPQTLAQ